MFNHFNTYRKIRGGENRKTEIRGGGEGVVGICLFVLFYYNLKRWSTGVGVWDCLRPCRRVLIASSLPRHRPHLLPDYCQLPLATPMDCSTNGFLQWIRRQSILSLHLSSEGFLVHSLCVRSVKNAMRCYTGVIIYACCIA